MYAIERRRYLVADHARYGPGKWTTDPAFAQLFDSEALAERIAARLGATVLPVWSEG